MKCISNPMKSGTQSWSSSLILNIIFETYGSWPEIKNLGRFGLKIAMYSNFYEIRLLVQIKHASSEYSQLSRALAWWLAQNVYRLRMIIGCKIRLTARTWLIALTPYAKSN